MTKCSLCGQSFDPGYGPCGCGFAKPKPTVAIKVSKLREWNKVIGELQGAIDGAK